MFEQLATRTIEVLWEARLVLVLACGMALLASAAHRARRRVAALALAASGALALLYLPAVVDYLQGISSDSFAELSGYDPSEAAFYLSTALNLLEPASPRRALAMFVAATMAAAALAWLLRRQPPPRLALAGLLLAGGATLALAWHVAAEHAASTAQIATVRANFDNPPPALAGTPRALKLVVYVGESTSAMSWQLYGYPRATTPRLVARAAADPGLLVFERVLSTHVYTTPSLLDAFGIPVGPAPDPLSPSIERRYASVLAALAAAGIDARVLTNHGETGTWNVGGSVVFGPASSIVRSAPTRALGNNDWLMPRPYDHAFFGAELPRAWQAPAPQAIFLHSYAGHGPYLESIPPEQRAPVDGLLAGMSAVAVVGEALARPAAVVEGIEAYDSAMRYVDASLDATLAWLAEREEPAVLLYFADHGEAPWTGVGHDAARFAHEMLRVPALVYFNGAARAAQPEAFAAYAAAARARGTRTLAAVPGTVLDLFGLVPTEPLPTLRDAHQAVGPLVVRDVDGRRVGVDVVGAGPGRAAAGWDASDHATAVYRIAAGAAPAGAPSVCYHRADNLARLLRALLVADCVELDVAVAAGAAQVEVFHPPQPAAGFAFATALEAVGRTRAGLWVDAASIGDARSCGLLADALEAWSGRGRPMLVEFSPALELGSRELMACVERIGALGLRRSYYVPTELAVECGAALARGRDGDAACAALGGRIAAVVATGAFTDLSFDVAGLAAVRAAPDAAALRWNVWGVDVAGYDPAAFAGYGFVIVDSDRDPNRL